MQTINHSPLLKAIFANSKTLDDKIAVKVDQQEITYKLLWINILKSASLLKSFGINHKDRIILSAHKHPNFIYLYFAAQLLGITNVVIDTESNKERLRFIENKTSPKYSFGYISDSIPSHLLEDLDLDDQSPYHLNDANGITLEDTAEIIFTTGTTGEPKGVCLSHANIFSSATNINHFIGNDENDIEVLGLPICHSFGLGRIRCSILAGGTIIILSNFGDVRKFFKTIETFKATGFGVVPAAWNYIRKISGTRIKKFADQIKYIEIGSAPMSIETKKEMIDLFPNTRICMHYGLTEASRSCFIEFHDNYHLNSIGRPVSNQVEIEIFDSEGNTVLDGNSGEICVKGNMVSSHYLEEKPEDRYRFGDFIRTGDTGYKDQDGYLYLIGREKEIINVGGKKVSPLEVEETICSLGVGDCVCVPLPDDLLGEKVKCFIQQDSTNLSFEEIEKELRTNLESFKIPAVFEWIKEIPKTSSGKKQRLLLRGK